MGKFGWLAAAVLLGTASFSRAGEKIAKARTDGFFNIRYELTREKGRVRARQVKVTVRNAVCYFEPPSGRLKEHEEVHRRINESEARRIQKDMAAFEAPGGSLRAAEKMFRQRFHKRVEEVKKLHKEWDANHVFPQP